MFIWCYYVLGYFVCNAKQELDEDQFIILIFDCQWSLHHQISYLVKAMWHSWFKKLKRSLP
uniref:Uncharacterized protein n=1 Tax=Romanomermis culicivorax TaxID=13658 RepID=A0A915K132_ROMCU